MDFVNSCASVKNVRVRIKLSRINDKNYMYCWSYAADAELVKEPPSPSSFLPFGTDLICTLCCKKAFLDLILFQTRNVLMPENWMLSSETDIYHQGIPNYFCQNILHLYHFLKRMHYCLFDFILQASFDLVKSFVTRKTEDGGFLVNTHFLAV